MENSKKTILVIEDEKDIRELYSEMLKEAGYTVISEINGVAGLEIAKTQPWDLMLLDIMLPGSDGIEVLTKLKEAGLTENHPIIMLTNLDNEHLIAECFELGADGYLIKAEITPDKIISEVASMFAEKAS